MPPPWASLSTSALTRRPCPHARPRMPQRSPPVAMPPPWASLSTSALTRRPCPRVQTRTFLQSPPAAMPPPWAWPSTSFLSLCRDPRALSGQRPPVRAQMHSLQSSREAAPRRAQAAAPALRHRRTCLGCSWLCTLRVRLRARASCTRATPLRPARGVPHVPPPPPLGACARETVLAPVLAHACACTQCYPAETSRAEASGWVLRREIRADLRSLAPPRAGAR